MKKDSAGKYIQLGASALLIATALAFQTSAQPGTHQTRIRWEKLVYEDAKALIEEATVELAKNPRNAVALRMRSSAFYRNREAEKGKADAAAALALLSKPANAEEFEARCYANRRMEKHDEAILDCTKAIQLDPKFVWAYYNRGNAFAGKKLYPQAISDLTRASKLDPNFPDEYSVRGDVYFQIKEYDKSIAGYTKLIELEPKRASSYGGRGFVTALLTTVANNINGLKLIPAIQAQDGERENTDIEAAKIKSVLLTRVVISRGGTLYRREFTLTNTDSKYRLIYSCVGRRCDCRKAEKEVEQRIAEKFLKDVGTLKVGRRPLAHAWTEMKINYLDGSSKTLANVVDVGAAGRKVFNFNNPCASIESKLKASLANRKIDDPTFIRGVQI